MFALPLLMQIFFLQLREIEIVKLCLKHFRQQGYYAAYRALQAQTQVRLEHPHLSELHKSLVYDGDFQRAEEIITNCIDEGFVDEYLNRQDYKHNWRCQQIFETNMQPGKCNFNFRKRQLLQAKLI